MCDVLAIGPHPDDMELAAGGTIAMLTAAGREVVLCDLTRGERATRGTASLREEEAAKAAAALGVAHRECLDLPDAGVSARDPRHLAAVVRALRTHEPGLVIAMHWNDDHPDHVEGGELVRRAAYLSGLRNFPKPGKKSFHPARVLFAMGRRPFVPTLVVDVSAHYEAKREALSAYGSQFHRDPDDPLATPISDPQFLPRVEARDRYFGGQIGAVFGEPFHEVGPVRVGSAEDLLGEGAS